MGASDRSAPQVHHLQVALNEHGYYCGEDETVWWQFGMDTYSSLLTFQVGPLTLPSSDCQSNLYSSQCLCTC